MLKNRTRLNNLLLLQNISLCYITEKDIFRIHQKIRITTLLLFLKKIILFLILVITTHNSIYNYTSLNGILLHQQTNTLCQHNTFFSSVNNVFQAYIPSHSDPMKHLYAPFFLECFK